MSKAKRGEVLDRLMGAAVYYDMAKQRRKAALRKVDKMVFGDVTEKDLDEMIEADEDADKRKRDLEFAEKRLRKAALAFAKDAKRDP